MTRLNKTRRLLGLTLTVILATSLATVIPQSRAYLIHWEYCWSRYRDVKPPITPPELDIPYPENYKNIKDPDERAHYTRIHMYHIYSLNYIRHDPRLEQFDEAHVLYDISYILADLTYDVNSSLPTYTVICSRPLPVF